MSARLRSIWAAHWPIVTLLVVGLVVGLWVGRDYGASLDERTNAEAGEKALLAYVGVDDYFWLPALADHGPVYFMAFVSTSRAIHALDPSWSLPDGRHLTNYLMFLAGVLAFYVICLRVMPRSFAWMTTILFATQPLLFGHAFINQKDIPFLSLFLATIALGLTWMDRSPVVVSAASGEPGEQERGPAPTGRERIRREWERLQVGRKRWLIAFSLLACALILDLIFLRSIELAGRGLVVAAFNGTAPTPIQWLFTRIATDAYKTPVDLYLEKYDAAMITARRFLPPSMILALLISWSVALPSFADVWGFSKKVFPPALLASGVLLGALVCVRQIGAFAGGLITLAVFLRLRWKALFSLIVCWLVAAAVMVATWPYLWPDPVGRLLSSIMRVGTFPTHNVVFQSHVYSSADLPWTYFPTLVGLELTEPVVILMIIGMFVFMWRTYRARRVALRLEYAILAIWAAVPLVALLFSRMSVYGNIRQLLFVLPPFFILSGKGLEAVGSALRFKASGILLATLVTFPGVWGIVGLHPYEYTYFNAFTGGVAGADGKYELDHWCTSYREAIEITNGLAPSNATILAIPQSSQVLLYLRPDLRLLIGRRNVPLADIVVTCSGDDSEEWARDDFHAVYQVERRGAVFAKVWERVGAPHALAPAVGSRLEPTHGDPLSVVGVASAWR